eukprot:8826600-Pyramimonas_sp.AAC.1
MSWRVCGALLDGFSAPRLEAALRPQLCCSPPTPLGIVLWPLSCAGPKKYGPALRPPSSLASAWPSLGGLG